MTFAAFAAQWLLRSSVLILSGAVLVWVLRVRNPSARLAACTALLAGSLAIPLFTLALPQLRMPILRRSPPPPARALSLPMQVAIDPPAVNVPSLVVAGAAPPTPFDWLRLATALYAAVAAGLLLRIFAGLIGCRRLYQRSTFVREEVRESSSVASPVTVGVLRPAVLLPPDWRDWSPSKLEAVLAHERSHIRRGDPAVQLLSAVHRALLWASPASWLLHRAIVRASEEASDNDALAVTHDRAAYAEILLHFMQRGPAHAGPLAVPMARYDSPATRIRRILHSTVIARPITRANAAAVFALAAPLAYLAAAAHPEPAPQPAAAPAVVTEAPAPAPAPPTDTTPDADPPQDPAPTPTPTPTPAPTPLTFEVASIVPEDAGPVPLGVTVYPGGRLSIHHASLWDLIATAFHLSFWQLSRGDGWIGKEQFNVEAKPPADAIPLIKDLRFRWYTVEDPHLREMLQSLLADRFQLQVHRETRTGDVLLLERNDKPFAAKTIELTDEPFGINGQFGSVGYAGGQWDLSSTTMPQLAEFAGDFVLHQPVIDHTGLTGIYHYRQRQPDLEPRYGGDQSDSFKSFLAEAGLKLVKSQGPIEYLVIDHASPLSPN